MGFALRVAEVLGLAVLVLGLQGAEVQAAVLVAEVLRLAVLVLGLQVAEVRLALGGGDCG